METCGTNCYLDHYAMRVADRYKTSDFICKAFSYKIQQEFKISFPDGTFADCVSLEPITKAIGNPEIFISSSTDPNSIVGLWVAARAGIGGIHHVAMRTEDIEQEIKRWREHKLAEFTSEIIDCPEEGLRQIFTKEHPLTGIVYELIQRTGFGFCAKSVARLMAASADPQATVTPDYLRSDK